MRSSPRRTSWPGSTTGRSTSLLEDANLPVELLTGSLGAASARRTLEMVASGMAPIVVGTHALLQDRVAFAALGLAVIDEQHRFGVEQRGQLEAKAGGGRSPHVLLMTATPIPRTLGQVLYADLDVSNLRTPPEGRLPIRTGIRRPDELAGTWDKVREEASAGHRSFVVVPLIDEAEADDAGAGDRRRAAGLLGRRRRPPPRRRRCGCARCSRRCGSGWSTAG